MFASSTYTGIDIGAWSLKAVSMTGRKGAYTLKSAAHMKLPPDARHGELSPKIVADFLKANSMAAPGAGVLMTGHSLMFRHFYLPPMPDKDLREAVKWEIRKEVAMAPADLVLDFVTADSGTRPDGKLSIIAFAGVRKEIDSILAFFKEAGVHVKVIEVVPTALLASFCLNNACEKDENQAMLDIGETKSTLTVLRNGTLAFAREISMGGQDFTRAAALHLKTSDGAEEFKHGASVKEVREVFSKQVERLSSEIHRSFDYFQAQYREGSVSKLFLTGGSASLSGLDSFVSDSIGIPAFIDDPFRKLKQPSDASLSGLAPCFSTAVGLALRAAGGP